LSLKVGLHQDPMLLDQRATLECLGDHKVVDFWSKGQIMNFQTSSRDIPFPRCSIHDESQTHSINVGSKT
jgi:hypothetical protein